MEITVTLNKNNVLILLFTKMDMTDVIETTDWPKPYGSRRARVTSLRRIECPLLYGGVLVSPKQAFPRC